jgi:hypothetical protein
MITTEAATTSTTSSNVLPTAPLVDKKDYQIVIKKGTKFVIPKRYKIESVLGFGAYGVVVYV